MTKEETKLYIKAVVLPQAKKMRDRIKRLRKSLERMQK